MLKKHTFIRHTHWDDEMEYDVYDRVAGSGGHRTIHTEHRAYIDTLLQEGVIDYQEADLLESATVADLERLCLENNIYVEILDEREE